MELQHGGVEVAKTEVSRLVRCLSVWHAHLTRGRVPLSLIPGKVVQNSVEFGTVSGGNAQELAKVPAMLGCHENVKDIHWSSIGNVKPWTFHRQPQSVVTGHGYAAGYAS